MARVAGASAATDLCDRRPEKATIARARDRHRALRITMASQIEGLTA
jgi:hypothetical protein